MSNALKLAVIGTPSMVLLYKAIGAEVFVVSSGAEAEVALKKIALVDNSEYAVVFIEESVYAGIRDDIQERLTKRPLPSVIPVPSGKTEKGKSFSLKRLSHIVEKAVGTDIS